MTVAEPTIVDAQKATSITLEQCRQHTTEQDCWLVVHGKVYDITTFLDEHPGGFDIILANTGKDATEDYEEIGHSNAATEMLTKYYIGEYAGGDTSDLKKAASALKTRAVSQPPNPALKLFQIALPALVVLLALLYIQFAR
ncbi:hypothetical protein WJX72_003117 [[Myrmecia] bisecta]|uniref:Cytochrome b5 heme-binding domain-containing protein n=1 Tax=[Myrmecia] bisecta TaxID=41462 RepID=A0AAW1PA21_9CHLO